MFISDALAQETPSAIHSILGFGGLWLPVIIVFFILFFFISLPKSKKQRKKFEKLSNMKRGDSIITASGIYGKIKKMPTNDTVVIEIAKDVEIKIKKIKINEVL